MSKIGYVTAQYGKQFNIAVANTYSYNILNGSNLPGGSFIISSNVDDNGNDTGSYALFVTDINGVPVRLTYTISQGNGLYYDDKKDSLKLNLDNDTLVADNNGIKFNIENHLSNDFVLEGNKIYVNTNNIPDASATVPGISSIDGRTIKTTNGQLYIDTDELQHSDTDSETFGTTIGDGRTIYVENGHASLIVDSFTHASNDTWGVVTGDNRTVNIEDGTVSVVTKNLDIATENNLGISKPDTSTIVFDDDGNITVDENNFTIATSTKYGLASIDTQTLNVENSVISVKGYDEIVSKINELDNESTIYKNKIDEYNEYLSSGNVLLRDKDIRLFVVNETSMTELDKPKDGEEPIKMPEQTVSVVFDIITSCDFILNIQFESDTNIFPNVDLFEVNYNDEFTYDKVTALNPATTYKSTEGERKKLTVKFFAKNYKNTVATEYTITSILFTIANSEDNIKSKTEKYSIVRYNSEYNALKKREYDLYKGESEYVLMQDTLRWKETISIH